MSKRSVDYTQHRKSVANMFIGVLTQNIPVRDALANFPKDCEDPTIIAAWHALCHLEADEDIRAKDEMYKQEQDEYLEYVAHTLSQGEELPENIIKAYIPYYATSLIPSSGKIQGIIKNLKKFLCC